MNEDHIPQLVAHRGYMQRYPENTWLGLKAAMTAGACWLEFDVQMCADETFILLHDGDLSRTAGDALSVFELDSEQLSRISVHEPERLGAQFAPLPVSTLDGVLEKLSHFPDIRFMVEIKEESLHHWGSRAVMNALLEKLDPLHGQCVLISYDLGALEHARRCSSLELGWVLREYNQAHLQDAESISPQFLICNERKVPAEEVPRPGPWQWMLYDIAEPGRALAWARRGVPLIETRDIGAMLKDPVLARRACRHGL